MRVVAAVVGVLFAGCSLIYEPGSGRDKADGAIPAEPCASDPDDVFRYEVTSGPLAVLEAEAGGVGGQVLQVVGDAVESTTIGTIPGPKGCGTALEFDRPVFIEVAHDPAWELSEGTLSFWYRAGEEPGVSGIVSKDRRGDLEGHIAVYQDWSDDASLRVVARVQDGGRSFFLCSEALDPVAWHEVEVTFGTEWALWVDGSRARSDGTVDEIGATGPCETGSGPPARFSGNDASWIFGASGARRDGPGVPPEEALIGGALDHIRLRDYVVTR